MEPFSGTEPPKRRRACAFIREALSVPRKRRGTPRAPPWSPRLEKRLLGGEADSERRTAGLRGAKMDGFCVCVCVCVFDFFGGRIGGLMYAHAGGFRYIHMKVFLGLTIAV